MEKYVKLQDVYDLLNKMVREPRYQHEDEDYYSGVAQVAGELVGVPTIELEEQSVGTWKHYSSTMMECSVCLRHVPHHRYEFCPHCSAKMKND
jgi:hypothetical protein